MLRFTPWYFLIGLAVGAALATILVRALAEPGDWEKPEHRRKAAFVWAFLTLGTGLVVGFFIGFLTTMGPT